MNKPNKGKIVTMPVADLIFDKNLYPRTGVDKYNKRHLREAYEAGADLWSRDPIKADSKTKIIADGGTRVEMLLEDDPASQVPVWLYPYKDKKELFIDAALINQRHGKKLDVSDKVHCLCRAQALKISFKSMVDALCWDEDQMLDILNSRTCSSKDGTFPAKPSVPKRLRGKKVSKKQKEIIGKMGGNSQAFTIRELINIIEGDLLDYENATVMGLLQELRSAIDTVLNGA